MMGYSCCDQKAPSFQTDDVPEGPDNAASSEQLAIPPPDAVTEVQDDARTSDASTKTVDTSADNCCEPSEEAPVVFCEDACCGNSAPKPGVKRRDTGPSDKIDGGSCHKVDSPCCVKDTVASVSHKDEIQGEVSSLRSCTVRAGGCCDFETSAQYPPVDSRESNVTDCCRGKASPCCDESCLDRLALRACEKESPASYVESDGCCSSPASCEDRANPKVSPCDRHRSSVRKQFATRLAAFECICRSLIALGQESCCDPGKKPSRAGNHSARSSSESCCARPKSSARSSVKSLSTRSGNMIEKKPKACDGSPAKLWCKPSTVSSCEAGKIGGSGKQHCQGKRKTRIESEPCVKTCCAPSERSKKQDQTELVSRDLESQVTGLEHVVLSISGMTCTGCETKLHRTLASVPGVADLKTSLVLSRAEFDIQLNYSSVEEVMGHLERTTEFKCERISYQGSSMVITTCQDSSLFANLTWPEGVVAMSPIDNSTIRVAFDPDVVGARDLMEKHWVEMAKLAPMDGDPALTAGSKHVRNVGWMTLLSAFLTIPVLVLTWAPLPGKPFNYDCVCLALATIVQIVIAGPFYPKALKALLFSRVIEMDLLIVLSTSAAYVFSVVSFGYLAAGKSLSIGQFFETSTLLVTLIMIGRYIAALARQKAVESISIRSLQTQTALLVEDPGLSEAREIDTRLLQYGDNFKVLPEMRIPTDGTVVSGSSEVNESMFTGHLHPVEKSIRSRVIAGTINGPGILVIRLTRLPGSNTVDDIANMVDEAKLSKPKMQDLADKVASYFVPVVVCLTIITFVIWIAIGVAVQGKSGSEATTTSITYAIAVLIVSCPCAIGLAVPMVVVIASGVAAKRGVIFKSANAIEVVYRTAHVVLDKTGTLTRGKLTVVSQDCLGHEEASLPLLLGLISDSKHPVSVAVGEYLRNKGVIATAISDVKSLPGQGMEGKLNCQLLQAGNSRWLGLSSHASVQPVLAHGYTAFCFAIDGTIHAVFSLEDSLRPDAASTVTSLRMRGMSVHVVSGDDAGATETMTTVLGIPKDNVRAGVSPADKQAYVQNLLAGDASSKEPIVVFCGDGTNDAAALAQATIGVHMNGGSNLAGSAADVVLMQPGLSGLLTMMDVSKLATNRIKFNFVWSFVYNLFAILLAAGAFVNARIPPEFAGLGELVSVLPVIAAAVLLRWSKPGTE